MLAAPASKLVTDFQSALLLAEPQVKQLLSSEHLSVDGTLLRAWASHTSLERSDGLNDRPSPPSGGNVFASSGTGSQRHAKGDFHCLLHSNQTNRSTSDRETRLFRKAPGVGALLSFMGHGIVKKRNGLVVASEISQATGRAQREAAIRIARSLKGAHQKTLGTDKGYDTKEFVVPALQRQRASCGAEH